MTLSESSLVQKIYNKFKVNKDGITFNQITKYPSKANPRLDEGLVIDGDVEIINIGFYLTYIKEIKGTLKLNSHSLEYRHPLDKTPTVHYPLMHVTVGNMHIVDDITRTFEPNGLPKINNELIIENIKIPDLNNIQKFIKIITLKNCIIKEFEELIKNKVNCGCIKIDAASMAFIYRYVVQTFEGCQNTFDILNSLSSFNEVLCWLDFKYTLSHAISHINENGVEEEIYNTYKDELEEKLKRAINLNVPELITKYQRLLAYLQISKKYPKIHTSNKLRNLYKKINPTSLEQFEKAFKPTSQYEGVPENIIEVLTLQLLNY